MHNLICCGFIDCNMSLLPSVSTQPSALLAPLLTKGLLEPAGATVVGNASSQVMTLVSSDISVYDYYFLGTIIKLLDTRMKTKNLYGHLTRDLWERLKAAKMDCNSQWNISFSIYLLQLRDCEVDTLQKKCAIGSFFILILFYWWIEGKAGPLIFLKIIKNKNLGPAPCIPSHLSALPLHLLSTSSNKPKCTKLLLCDWPILCSQALQHDT